MVKCSKCQKRVIVKNGKKLNPRTGEPHLCREDVYDLPERKIMHIFIPKTDRFKKPHRLRRQGSEPAWDGSPKESPSETRLASLEPLMQKYLRSGVKGQALVVAIANSTEFSVDIVAQWIQRNHSELKPETFYERNRRKKKR